MLISQKVKSLAVVGVLFLASVSVLSQTTEDTKLSSQYLGLAGSPKNADALVTGLRDGTHITLVASPDGQNPGAPSATFTPATGKLGYGNINIALSLAKADLAKAGISNPTPAQLAAALNGGTISTATGSVTMAGILALRQDGLGWGQIANRMGVKLGALVSASKTDKAGPKTEHVSNANTSGKSAEAHSGSDHGANGGNSGGGHGGNGGGGGGGGKK